MVICGESENAEAVAAFLWRFGLEYYGCGLPSAVGQAMELLLRPQRVAFSAKRRMAQYQAQGGGAASATRS